MYCSTVFVFLGIVLFPSKSETALASADTGSNFFISRVDVHVSLFFHLCGQSQQLHILLWNYDNHCFFAAVAILLCVCAVSGRHYKQRKNGCNRCDVRVACILPDMIKWQGANKRGTCRHTIEYKFTSGGHQFVNNYKCE